MLALLLTVAAAREMPIGTNPVGPLSASVAQSYADLDQVQDHILAAQAEESKEMDRILGPAPKNLQVSSSLMQTGEQPGVLDFSGLDSIQAKLNKLHTKMGGELENLKKITTDDEDFAKKAADEAKAAEEAAAAPSSLLETGAKEKAEVKDPDAPLRKMVTQLKMMHDLFNPLRTHLGNVKEGASTFEDGQMYNLNKMNNKVIKMMLHLVSAMHSKDPAEQKKAMDELHDGMAHVRLQMMEQHDAMEAHKVGKPLAPINDRLKTAIDGALTPLKARLEKYWEMDPDLATKFDVPQALEKLGQMKELASHVADSINQAATKAAEAKTPEEADAIDKGLKTELAAAKENLRLTFSQVQELTQAMALMPTHKGAKLIPYREHTKDVRARLLKAIQQKPEIAKSKIVEAALTHAAAIDGLANGYDRVVQLIPQLTKDIPEEEHRIATMKHIRSVLGAVKMEADSHDRALNQLAPVVERLAGSEVPASLTQTEKAQEDSPNYTPLLSAGVSASEKADEAGYSKIEQKLATMQDHLATEEASLKQTAQAQQNEQVQQLDGLMTGQASLVPMSLTEKKAVAIDSAGTTSMRREPVNATV